MTLLDLLFILFIILYATLDIIYILPTKRPNVFSPTCDLKNHLTTFSNCAKYNVTNSPILCLQNALGVSPDNHPIPTLVPLSGIVPYDIEHPTRDYAFSIYREDALLQFI
jgi:hypothetical protein